MSEIYVSSAETPFQAASGMKMTKPSWYCSKTLATNPPQQITIYLRMTTILITLEFVVLILKVKGFDFPESLALMWCTLTFLAQYTELCHFYYSSAKYSQLHSEPQCHCLRSFHTDSSKRLRFMFALKFIHGDLPNILNSSSGLHGQRAAAFMPNGGFLLQGIDFVLLSQSRST
ncbi:hypothetical protein C8R48DRAFT_674913 [Suillus tomentosus]|nr:hypothetical protein C8R48DRAFT_674913 [Suillus tomentosus]